MLRTKTRFEHGTAQDLLDRLGVPAYRIFLDPPPGTARVRDVIRHVDGDNKRLVELVDGTLVEKAMSAEAAFLATLIAHWIHVCLETNGDTGMILGADGTLRIMPGLVRIPDVSYTSWDKLPNRKVPLKPVPHLVPDLAIEVCSPGNRRGEMRRKLGEYLGVGIAEVWIVYPKTRSIRIYRPGMPPVRYAVGETLVSAVLPDFQMSLAKLFEKLDDVPAATTPKKRKH